MLTRLVGSFFLCFCLKVWRLPMILLRGIAPCLSTEYSYCLSRSIILNKFSFFTVIPPSSPIEYEYWGVSNLVSTPESEIMASTRLRIYWKLSASYVFSWGEMMMGRGRADLVWSRETHWSLKFVTWMRKEFLPEKGPFSCSISFAVSKSGG